MADKAVKKDKSVAAEAGSALKVHHLRPAPGAKTAKTRVGRGEGSKGKTAGRGTKGTKARYQVPTRFEGGQMPLHMRLPKLRGFLSDRAALVVTGVIWGFWHAPVIAMGHNYGTDYWGFPWLGILAMTVFCVVFGIIEGYVSIKLKSAIPAAMIHSLINAGAALPLYLIKGEYNVMLGPAITGLIGILPFAVLAVILLVKAGGLRESKASNEQPTTSEPL